MPQRTLFKGSLINVIYKCMYMASNTDTLDCMWIYVCECMCLRNGWFPDVAWWETGPSANRRWSGLTLISSWNQSQIFKERESDREQGWQEKRERERDGRRSSCYNKRRLIHYAKQTFLTHQQLLILCFAICCTKWFMHFRKNFSWENKIMTKEKKWETLFLLTSLNLYSSTISRFLTT